MQDQIGMLIAAHVQSLADVWMSAIGEVSQPTMRDRFALALVAGDMGLLDIGRGDDHDHERMAYAAHVYDLAEALDLERKRRNEQEGE